MCMEVCVLRGPLLWHQGRRVGRCGARFKSSPAWSPHVEGRAITEECCQKPAQEQLCLQGHSSRTSDSLINLGLHFATSMG